MEDKSAPQEGPREGAAPASPGAGPTTGDEVLKSAMAGSALVSFVFGMEVTADLVRAHAAS